MLFAVLIALVCAVALGTWLLIPNWRYRTFSSRAALATTHGILGTLGLVGYAWWLAQTAQRLSPVTQTAAGLAGIGLVLGAATFLVTRHKRKPPDLILTSHVIFAGMGAFVIIAQILS